MRAQPSTATRPSRASIPTATRSGNFAAAALTKTGIAHRRRAEHDTANAAREPGLDRGEIANAAAELHVEARQAQNRLDRGRIGRAARKGAVEIDDVQPRESGLRKDFRLAGGIVVEDRRLGHVALPQAHAAALFQIDRRKEDHGRQARKFEISLSPSAWLFSG